MLKTVKFHHALMFILTWLCLRVIVLLFFNDFTPDDGYFLNISESVLHGHLRMPLYDSVLHSDVYFFLLGFTQHYLTAFFLKTFGFGNWFWVTKLPSLIEALVLLLFFAYFTRKKQWEPIYTLALIGIIAFEPYFWQYTSYLRPDIICLLFLTLSYIMLFECIFGEKQVRDAILAGVFAGFAIISKWEAMSAIPIAGIILLLCLKNTRTILRNGLLFSFSAAVICAPIFLWIFTDPFKREILIEQLNSGKAVIYAKFLQLPFLLALYRLALQYLLDSGFLLLSMGYDVNYQSGAILIIGTVLVYSACHVRNAQDRYWMLLILAVISLIAVISMELKGQRVFMIFPVVAYRFITIVRERPKESMAYLIASSIFLMVVAFLLKFKYILCAGGLTHNFAMIVVAISCIYAAIVLLCMKKFNCKYGMKKYFVVTGLIAFMLAFLVKAAVTTTASPGYFYPHHLEPLRENIKSKLCCSPHIVITQPQYYMLFPPNCKVYSSDLYTYYLNYRYWPTYHDFFNHIGADTILITEEARTYWSTDEFAERYINEYFFPAGDFRAGGNRFFIFFSKRYLDKNR